MNEAINNKYRKQKKGTHFLMCFCLISLLITAAAPVYSLDITLTGEQHFYTDQDNRVYGEGEEPDPEDIEEYKQQSQTLTASAFHDFDTTENEFSFSAGLSYQTDDLYSPSQGGMYYSGYFRLEEGGLQFSRQFAGYDFDFSAGRITPDLSLIHI